MLYMIGIGLNDEKDITLRGLELVKKSKYVFLESYTSRLNCNIKKLEELYEKKIILADRNIVEKNSDEILNKAKDDDVAFLVIGDIFGATTHTDLMLRAKEKGIKVKFVHNASILNAIGVVGLELYKFGKTTSIVFEEENWLPETPYDVIKNNLKMNLHTLCLLDIKVKEESKENLKNEKKVYEKERYMTINEALKVLLKIEDKRKEKILSEDTMVVGCARIGNNNFKIKYGKIKDILKEDFGEPLHCLIIPAKLHFVEEEALELY